MSILDLLQYGFLQRAILAALLTGILAAVLGVPLVLRRLSMFGHGFAHVSWAGVAIGIALGIYPLGVALVLTMAGAIVLQLLWSRGIVASDTALGMIASVGFAVGVVVISAAGGFSIDLTSYLFGNLLAVSQTDLLLMVPAALGLLLLFGLLYKELFYVTFNEEAARLSGLPVDALNVLLMALTAATVVLAAKVVGLLLVSALLVLPAATSLQVARSFRGAILLATLAGVVSVVLGVLAAILYDVATGGAVVLAAALLFAVVAGARRALARMGAPGS